MRFLLLDRILRLEMGKEVVARKNVTNSEDFFADHFTNRPIMPGCLILEACDQAARLLLGKSAGFASLPCLESVASGKFQHFVQPGDSLEVHVVVVRQTSDGVEVRASASVEGRAVARVSLTYRLEAAVEDPGAARACERMREFYRVLTTDLLQVAREYQTQGAGSGREVESV
jgi:3-hydroxyacyl-[acyl-carrier-protein] dehydratase